MIYNTHIQSAIYFDASYHEWAQLRRENSISGFALPRWSPKSLPREMLPEDEEEEEEEEQVIAGETDLDNCGDLYP